MDNKKKTKSAVLRISSKYSYIFNAIKSGKKKTETRAGSSKFINIKRGDTLVFVCGKEKFEKKVKKVKKFKDVSSLLKVYKPQDINPKTRNLEESEKMYYSFPGYREKIKKYGIIAFELLKLKSRLKSSKIRE